MTSTSATLSIDKNIILGKGAMGTTVHLGKFGDLIVAVKSAFESSQRKRAIREIRSLIELKEKLSHQNVLKYYWHQVHTDSDRIDIVLEFCNLDLKTWMDNKTLAHISMDDILSQTTSGLQVLHRNRILHQDLKPANILMVSTENVVMAKIADFGISKFLRDDRSGATITASSVGTERWRAPEVLKYMENISDDDEQKTMEPIKMVASL